VAVLQSRPRATAFWNGLTAGATATRTLRAGVSKVWLDGLAVGRAISQTVTAEPASVSFGVQLEAESYDLVLTFRDRAGQLTDNYLSYLTGIDNDVSVSPFDPDGSVTLRLPKGRYLLGTYVVEDGTTGGTLLVQPQLNLTGDQHLAVDARPPRP
jgi:hypothetical protein